MIQQALAAMDVDYLQSLVTRHDWLPGSDRLLAAFQRDRKNCRYILFGESPYPRKQSANGIAFHDAAVQQLWSENGLSKQVNRATSLRNLIKTMLLAENLLNADSSDKVSQQAIAAVDKTPLIQTADDLFQQFNRRGFLLLNATPVLSESLPVKKEAVYWRPFINRLLKLIAMQQPLPTLILWGKISAVISSLPAASTFPTLISEHPYNISFLHNPLMRQLFSELNLLHRQQATGTFLTQ